MPGRASLGARFTERAYRAKQLIDGSARRWQRQALSTDAILTQRLCDVCAVGYGSVAALACTLPGPPAVVNLEPSCLSDIYGDILRVAEAMGVEASGHAVVEGLRTRVQFVEERAANAAHRPRCFLMEWIDPPFCSGHWGPELVEIAGGAEPLGRKGEDSTRIRCDDVLEAQPEVIVLACCGYEVARTLEDLPILKAYPDWENIPAVQNRRVYVVNGSAFFSRPGPRVVDSLEILAEILHPEQFGGCFPDRGVARLTTKTTRDGGKRDAAARHSHI
jgi:iron complex transport system substrate-binding protein